MHGIVLGTGPCLEDLWIIPLQSFDKRYGHATRQIGVLAIGLLTASPAGITEDVDIGRSKGQATVASGVARGLGQVEFGPRLVGDGRGYPAK